MATDTFTLMATDTFTRSTTFALLLLVTLVGLSNAEHQASKETKMVFYMHDQLTGAKPTALPVAMHKNATALDFSTITVINDVVTEGIKRHSEQVGRAQGIYPNSALDGTDIHLLFSIIFTNKKYNGSTLEIQGAERWTLKQREASVVSGTGVFQFARGYANLETAYSSGSNAVGKFNVTLLHY